YVRFVPELQSLGASCDEPPVMVIPGMARILDTFRLLHYTRRRFNVARFGDSLQLGANPYRIADVFQQMRADREIERPVRYWPRPAIAQVRLNPSFFRIPRFDS